MTKDAVNNATYRLKTNIERRYGCKCRFDSSVTIPGYIEIICEFKQLNWLFVYPFYPREIVENYNSVEGQLILALESKWMHRLFDDKA